MRRIATLERIKTQYPFGVLTCDVVWRQSQTVIKKHEPALTLPPVLASVGQYDTDAVELAEGMMWVTRIFRLYQWREVGVGLSVEPYEVARISFMPNSWEQAHGLCHTLVYELNNEPVSDAARQILELCKE